MYDQSINLKALLLLIVLMVISIRTSAQNESSYQSQDSQILSKAILDSSLWAETSFNLEEISKIYLLDHGVTLNILDQFSLEEIAIEVIQKNQLSQIGSAPLVQVHTFHVENDMALVRLYLRYVIDGSEKNTNTELRFNKNGGTWNIVTNE
ncbi:hypothetical protein [Maribacter sp. 4G9]|uniref:hypothetical protein n=1 Tax=Maribacter sp. 4G9 TaxID=1889777 RepID=UPI000C153CBB|nr:hypothetical protein [Maribacter sp. 4G9]PIB37728.1 hypothetical protein BFP75_20375 [Maribacter sp. 4G9]